MFSGGRRGGRRRGGGGGPEDRPQSEREQALALMAENGCLPEDFSAPDFSSCEERNHESLSQLMQCIANRYIYGKETVQNHDIQKSINRRDTRNDLKLLSLPINQ